MIALLTIVILVFPGCNQSAAPSSPAPTQVPSPTALTPAEIISQAGEKLGSISSFHFVLDHNGGGTPISGGIEMTKADGDVVKPDKLKMTITGAAMGMTIEVQLITIGDQTYMTNPFTSQWDLLPNDFKVLSVFDPNSGIAAILKGLNNPNKLNDEPIQGVNCYHLSGGIDSGKLSSITGSSVQGVNIATEVWVGKDDFWPRQFKLDGKITDTEKPGIVRTLSLSAFNSPVSIVSPK